VLRRCKLRVVVLFNYTELAKWELLYCSAVQTWCGVVQLVRLSEVRVVVLFSCSGVVLCCSAVQTYFCVVQLVRFSEGRFAVLFSSSDVVKWELMCGSAIQTWFCVVQLVRLSEVRVVVLFSCSDVVKYVPGTEVFPVSCLYTPNRAAPNSSWAVPTTWPVCQYKPWVSQTADLRSARQCIIVLHQW
jgi:hypothetical protein